MEIKPVETDKSNVKQPDAVEKGILPQLPASYLVVGRSGSGKSTILYNLLTNEKLLGGYFNYIFVFSDVKVDDILAKLELPEENYINDFDEEKVSKIMKNIENKIEDMGLAEASKDMRIAFIFDDLLNKQQFLKSNIMRKLASANRHFLISFFVLTQYYRAIPPVIRTNASGIIYFPASLAENEKLADEQCPPNMSKKEFIKMIDHATSEKHSFMFINNRAKSLDEKIRKGFDRALSTPSRHVGRIPALKYQSPQIYTKNNDFLG